MLVLIRFERINEVTTARSALQLPEKKQTEDRLIAFARSLDKTGTSANAGVAAEEEGSTQIWRRSTLAFA